MIIQFFLFISLVRRMWRLKFVLETIFTRSFRLSRRTKRSGLVSLMIIHVELYVELFMNLTH